MPKSLKISGPLWPISREKFEEAEKIIGVKLPEDLYRIVQYYDSLGPEKKTFTYDEGEGIASFYLMSFRKGDSRYIAETYTNWDANYPEDKNFVPFALTAHMDQLMFYYGDCGRENPNPSVWLWWHDEEDKDLMMNHVADSFEAFLDGLLPDDIFDDYEAGSDESPGEYAARKLKERENDPSYKSLWDQALEDPNQQEELKDVVTTTVYYGEGAEDMEPVVEKRGKE